MERSDPHPDRPRSTSAHSEGNVWGRVASRESAASCAIRRGRLRFFHARPTLRRSLHSFPKEVKQNPIKEA